MSGFLWIGIFAAGILLAGYLADLFERDRAHLHDDCDHEPETTVMTEMVQRPPVGLVKAKYLTWYCSKCKERLMPEWEVDWK